MSKFYMTWREDFDDQYGWFDEYEDLENELDRLMNLKDEDGEWSGEFDPNEIMIIEGFDRSNETLREYKERKGLLDDNS